MTEHLRERVVSYVDLLSDDIGQIQQTLAQVRGPHVGAKPNQCAP